MHSVGHTNELFLDICDTKTSYNVNVYWQMDQSITSSNSYKAVK